MFNFIVAPNIIEIYCAVRQLMLLLSVINEILLICRELTACTFKCVSIDIITIEFLTKSNSQIPR